MKHVFVIDTVGMIGLEGVTDLRHAVGCAVDKVLGEDTNAVLHYCNAPSAIRAVYNLYSAPHDQSPDQLGSAK